MQKIPKLKFIGKGYYYNVYDLGNGRVRKIPRSQLGQILQLFQWYIVRPRILIKEFLKFPFSRKKTEEQCQVSKKVISIAPQYFGNTIFDGYVCEQDKAVQLGDIMKVSSEKECIEYCKEYARLVHELWKLGIGEKIFNFAINSGVTPSGKFTLLDTNEYTFEKTKAEAQIISKRPFRAASFRRLPEDLKSPIRELFEKEFTIEKFNQLWKTA